jgi:hypothetical protein
MQKSTRTYANKKAEVAMNIFHSLVKAGKRVANEVDCCPNRVAYQMGKRSKKRFW